jgi:N-acetylmuramoyl-L-alanine amidase CwlA
MNIEKIGLGRISKWTLYLEGMKDGGRIITRSSLKREIDTVTIHWIGAFPGQIPEDSIRWWNDDDNFHSTNYLVKNSRIVQTYPDDYICWHTGDTLDSQIRSIGIEVFPKDKAGEFSSETIQTLKWLIDLLKTRHPIETINRHYDWSRKDCPRFYTPYVQDGDREWEILKSILEG